MTSLLRHNLIISVSSHVTSINGPVDLLYNRKKGINVEVDGITPDMNEILREIRVEYEQIQVKNRDEAEEWYKVR